MVLQDCLLIGVKWTQTKWRILLLMRLKRGKVHFAIYTCPPGENRITAFNELIGVHSKIMTFVEWGGSKLFSSYSSTTTTQWVCVWHFLPIPPPPGLVILGLFHDIYTTTCSCCCSADAPIWWVSSAHITNIHILCQSAAVHTGTWLQAKTLPKVNL